MTPWYQLTRLVWWFRSPYVASGVFGVLGGLLASTLGALGTLGPPGSDPVSVGVFALGAIVPGAIIGGLVWFCRQRWAEMEGLTDWERARLVHVVHFGEDPGTEALAAATMAFAAWRRERLERMEGGIGAFAALPTLLCLRAFEYVAAGDLVRALIGVAEAAAILVPVVRWYRSRDVMRTNLWRAEWYSAQRLRGESI